MNRFPFFVLLISLLFVNCTDDPPRRAEVLFFGKGIADAEKYASWMAIELFKSGVNVTFTGESGDLNKENLELYDGLIIYSTIDTLSPDQEDALKGFVSAGKGLTVLNIGSSCFKNSDWYGNAVGGSAVQGAEGEITVHLADTSSQVVKGFSGFETTDVIYQHNNLQPDITILIENGNTDSGEPYAWTRKEGKGRIFYTALGSSEMTWKKSNFLRLLRNGVFWTLGSKVQQLVEDLKIPRVSIYGDSIADFTARHDVPGIQDPQSPEEAVKLIQKPVGFEVELFASEPDIVNPIAMNWDEKGRLWVIEGLDYPNDFVETDGAKNDQIKICEDTNGDGKADKFTVFADELNIATSLTFVNDGVLVSMAPHFIYLKDTDGDDVADLRDTIMTGWRKFDTHAGPSHLQYSFDNKIWGVTGYSGFDGYINGKRQIFGQGLYRFNPDGSDFEYLATTSNNTWGLGMTEDNNVFISTANNTHSAFYSMPEWMTQRRIRDEDKKFEVNAIQKIDGHYNAHPLTPNLRQVDVVGGFTSAAGHQFYTARNFPEEYWNRIAFVAEPTIRLVHNAILEADGAGFAESDGWNFMASSDEWFGPVQAKVGPDGAVWVVDWYNFIIQHNVFVPRQAPSEKVLPFKDQPHGEGNAFESELRDKMHGRIYRLVYKGGGESQGFELSKDDVPGLLKALKSDNKFWRTHAQRLLVERKNKDVVSDLIKIVDDQSVDAIALNAPAIHALWTMKGLNAIHGHEKALQSVIKSLDHPSPGVRKAAIQVLPANEALISDIKQSNIIHDPHLNTRLAAFVKLAEFPSSSEIVDLLIEATDNIENANDRWLAQALIGAIVSHEEMFYIQSEGKMFSSFGNLILESLGKEEYILGRRSRLQFSPDVSNKGIVIETMISRNDGKDYNGLIAAQGNKKEGYILYAENDRIFFNVYRGSELFSVSDRLRGKRDYLVEATLSKDSKLLLKINNKIVDENEGPAVFKTPLAGYLRTGQELNIDNKFLEGQSEFTGNMGNVKVKLVRGEYKHPGDAVNEDGGATVSSDQTIVIKTVKDLMQYDKKEITVKAGSRVTLIVENPDAMPHNLLIIEPGTLEIVGKAADEMLKYSGAAEKEYIPDVDEVMYHTPLLQPGDSYSLTFDVPDKTGNYPYVCTFPGHWRGMNGVMKVIN